MAIEAPIHVQRRVLVHQRHLIHRPVTRGASNPFVYVNAVIEIDEIGQPVHLHPGNRFIGAVTATHGFQIIDIAKQDGMAIHAGLCWRDSRVSRGFHAGMTVTTIDAVIAGMVFVAELNGLDTRYALVGDIGRPRHYQNSRQRQPSQNNRSEQTKTCQKIRTSMKNLGHVSVALE